MKITDNLVKKVGSDKLLHFLIAGWTTLICTLINWLLSLAVACILIGLNYFKEIKWDSEADMVDLYAAVGGCSIAFILLFIL